MGWLDVLKVLRTGNALQILRKLDLLPLGKKKGPFKANALITAGTASKATSGGGGGDCSTIKIGGSLPPPKATNPPPAAAIKKKEEPPLPYFMIEEPRSDLNKPNHTAVLWDKKDYRNVRFTNARRYVNPNFPMILKHKTKVPMHSNQRTEYCNGGDALLGHPIVFYNLDQPGYRYCFYCGQSFIKDKPTKETIYISPWP